MNTIRVSLAALAIATTFTATPATAADCTPAVNDGWVRLPPMAMPMLAGFAIVDNACAAPATIVGATSPAFADVSVHETRIVEGVSRMRAIPELVIAPGASATLQPGGLHLMLMDPVAPLEAGDMVEIDFQLKDGGVVRGQFQVRKPGA